ncbi:hypothetical protein MHC_03060 [Mycoplasma haemocanis str. Illinois]|uniref:Uncharacterized protein n=1 Tax=Mycoplasma haemocanis (strain Illinois) TaxID=1111676 RepID=H6N750_MYCHN|nr:hypothetical protein [Mycoplasma haemocanis]AEW45472.1 hypothetical protein MHC_03060 [Mycoplasma haemocanis str. Illinois]
MSLGYLKAVFIAVAGISGAAGMVYVGNKFVIFSLGEVDNDEIILTIKDKLKGRLINRENFSKEWNSRLEKLKLDQTQDLNAELNNIKDKGTGEDLKKWCEDSAIEPYVENSSLVKDTEKYCTYLLKEQISNLITGTGESVWKDAKDRLDRMQDDQISEVMRKVQSDKNLDSWCTEKYETPFTDKNDSLYLDVFKFCKKVENSSPGKN